MIKDSFRFGDWQVSPASNSLSKGELRHQIEPRLMEVLTALCHRANSVISTEELLLQCWGATLYGDNPVHKTIAQLRRVLGDSAADARYIETIRKRGYRAIAEVVLAHGASGAAVGGSWSDGSPFRGLESFDERHASVFFGRAEATAELLRAIHARTTAGRAFVLVLGASGSGKTSLIRAGVLPGLMRDGGFDGITVESSATLDLGQSSVGELFMGLADALLAWQVDQQPVFPVDSRASLGSWLNGSPEHLLSALRRVLEHRRRADGSPRRVALLIDRLEAIFSLPGLSEPMRLAFLASLDALARSGQVIVIAACRNDFYPRLAEYPSLMEGKASGAHFDLPSPTYAEVAQMIRLPAAAANLTFGVHPQSQTRLDDVLSADISGSPDALPLLQYTLQALYDGRTPYGEMTFETFRHLGGIEGAIGMRAEAVIQSLGTEEQASVPHVLSLLVTLSLDETAVTSRRALWSALPDEAERTVVRALVESRLFVSELVAGQPVFGVAHEALLRHWSRASQWIEEHRALLRVRGRIGVLASRWVAENRRADLLLPRGKQLEEAQTLLDSNTVRLSQDERDLIVASARRARFRRRLSYSIFGAIILLALSVGVLGVIAAGAEHRAQLRRTEAEGLMGYMLGDFADKMRPLGRLDLLNDISTKALQYLSDSPGESTSQAALTQRAQALAVIAEVSVARGDATTALTALTSARAILLQQLKRDPDNIDALKASGTNSFWLGRIYTDKGEWIKAENFFAEYESYSDRRNALQPLDVDGWIEQAYARNNMGTMLLKRGNARQAAQEFQQAVDLKLKALTRRGDDSSLKAELADGLTWLALAKQQSGELREASQLYERALQTIESLHEARPGDALWIFRLACAIQYNAELKLALGQDRDAYEEFRRAASMLDEIIRQQPDNRVWLKSQMYIELEEFNIGSAPVGINEKLAALTAIDKRLDTLTALYPTNAEWGRFKGIAQMQLAVVAQSMQEMNSAEEDISNSENVLNKLYLSNGSDLRVKEALANTLLVKASMMQGSGSKESQQTLCRRASNILAPEATSSLDFRVLVPWTRASICLGDEAASSNAKIRLARIGYRDHDYLAFVSKS